MNQSRGEKAQRRAQKKENQLTKLLLTLTFTFLALIALQCITQCFFMLQPKIVSNTSCIDEFSIFDIMCNSNSVLFIWLVLFLKCVCLV